MTNQPKYSTSLINHEGTRITSKLIRRKRLEALIDKAESQLDRSPAILTSDNFIRSNKIIRTKWPIYVAIGHFVLTSRKFNSKASHPQNKGQNKTF